MISKVITASNQFVTVGYEEEQNLVCVFYKADVNPCFTFQSPNSYEVFKELYDNFSEDLRVRDVVSYFNNSLTNFNTVL